MEELKNFWKERCILISFTLSSCFLTCPRRSAIEEEYAKRLGKLAKVPLGRDEIGYVDTGTIHVCSVLQDLH
jgi:hypothetical protein